MFPSFLRVNYSRPPPAIPEAAPLELTVPAALAGLRLDQALARLVPQHSRSRLADWIDAGQVTLDGDVVAAQAPARGRRAHRRDGARRMRPCFTTRRRRSRCRSCTRTRRSSSSTSRPAWSCIRAAATATARCSTRCCITPPRWPRCRAPASSIGSTRTRAACMVVAKTLAAQTDLVRQLAARTVKRDYLAVVRGDLARASTVDAPIGRHPTAAHDDGRRRGRQACAHARRRRSSASATRRSCAARSKPAARTRSACISPRSAIRWSAIRRMAAGAPRRSVAGVRAAGAARGATGPRASRNAARATIRRRIARRSRRADRATARGARDDRGRAAPRRARLDRSGLAGARPRRALS